MKSEERNQKETPFFTLETLWTAVLFHHFFH